MSASRDPSIDPPSAAPEERPAAVRPLPPPDLLDPVIEAYKRDVDRSLLRQNLKMTTQQRSEQFERLMETVFELQRHAGGRREES